MKLDDLIAAERTAPAEATKTQTHELWRSIERSAGSVVPTAGAPLGAAKASTLVGKVGGALSSTAGKLLLASTVVTGGVVGANSVMDNDAPQATRPVAAASPLPSRPPRSASSQTPGQTPGPTPAPAAAVPTPVPSPVLQPPEAVPAPQAPAATETPPAKARPTAKPKATATATVKAELALIRRTQAAVRGGDHGQALTLAQRHAKHYPNGAFVEDREALRALALCDSGDAKASSAASTFLKRWPKSMHRSRIEAACE